MKKLLSVVLLFIVVSVANAQEFKPFQLYTGIGYAIPQGGGGVLFGIEPAYRINDAIAVGLRWETALMARVVNDQEGSVAGTASYTLNGKYYLSNNKFRPYVGLGLGIYNFASVTAGQQAGGVAAGSEFGFYPRIGFDLGHFNINLDYNIIGASEAEGIDNNGDPATFDVKNSYIGIRIGGFFFGGRK